VSLIDENNAFSQINGPATYLTSLAKGGALFTQSFAIRHPSEPNPWVNFSNVPSNQNLRFSRFPTDFTTLPTVSIVVPNLNDDMHDGSVSTGDTWARNHIDANAQWAKTHNSLLIVTFDEDDDNHGNQIFTVFYGQSVKTGSYSEHITHYSVLRTLEDMYGLSCTANACNATAITDAFA
jgi:hypothetical protein